MFITFLSNYLGVGLIYIYVYISPIPSRSRGWELPKAALNGSMYIGEYGYARIIPDPSCSLLRMVIPIYTIHPNQLAPLHNLITQPGQSHQKAAPAPGHLTANIGTPTSE